MQIQSQYKTKQGSRWKSLPLFLAIVFLGGLMVLALLSNKEQQNTYFCDMEKSVETANGHRFKSGGTYFLNGETQNSDQAFNGKYSARCDLTTKYGPTYVLENVNAGDIVEASVWQESSEGYGSLTFQGGWPGYYEVSRKAKKVHRGWEQLYLIDTIPLGVKDATLKIYPLLTSKEGKVYFDDFKINHIKRKNQNVWKTEKYNGPNLDLTIEEKDLAKLKIKRTEALDRGNLITGRKDLVKAKLKDDKVELDVQVRLKGDLLDHLQGKKWSFRIVPSKEQAWNNMREFSVHNTASRAHLLEWVFHEMLRDEDILTTRYDFVQLALNNETLGIYAYEEHFAYPILYQQNRERGPIIRISEDGLWQYAAAGISDKIPWFESAHIEAFEAKEILKDKNLTQKFIEGQQNIYDYINGDKTPGEIFDIDRMAKFIAIMDVCMAWHAFGSTNQRFYYNGVTGKLEPIGYDGYSDDGIKWYQPPLIYGGKVNTRVSKRTKFRNGDAPFNYFLFNDFAFMEKYNQYLETFTSETYIQSFLEKHLSEIKSREQFLQREYRDYYFDEVKTFKNASTIRKVLYPAENVTVKAYKQSNGEIILENYHQLPIEIIGFGNKRIQYKTPERLILESFHPEVPVKRYTIPVKGKAKVVFCKTLGTSKVISLPIFDWPAPVSKLATPTASIKNLAGRSNLIIKDSSIYIKSGTQIFNQDLLIPSGYALHISKGTTIQLTNQASIVSYGPVFIKGTKDAPVFIKATQGGQGMAVLNTNERSMIEHTTFQDLSARNKNGQIMEGGVTFYQADLSCTRCFFKNSQAKDALNFIESKYRLEDVVILNASGDGIDANQSSGVLINFMADKIGKDAIEITGGYLNTRGVTVNKAFGAALNLTRNSSAELANDFTIKNSEKGIMASDLSKITANFITLEKVNQAFLVFQKLPEYGPAEVSIRDFNAKEVNRLHVLEPGAKLTLKNKKVDVR